MELKWSYDLEDELSWTETECMPIKFNQKLYYAFESIDRLNLNWKGFFGKKVSILIFDNHGNLLDRKEISFKYQSFEKNKISLTSKWGFELIDNILHLKVGGILINVDKCKTVRKNNKVFNRFVSIVKDEYYFNEFVIKYNGRSTLECFNVADKTSKWKIKIKGYIYTELELKNGHIYFGTAGKGGAFYNINLMDGTIITEFINQNSSIYSWYQNYRVIRNVKNELVIIDPELNVQIDLFSIKRKSFLSPLLIDHDEIITTVFDLKSLKASILGIKI
jgi:hypothetical protein